MYVASLENLFGLLVFLDVPSGTLILSMSYKVASSQAGLFLFFGILSRLAFSHISIG
jgi:hypothetical protein